MMGLIGSAMAGGLAGAGAAGERAFARLGEQQGRIDFERLRADIETQRQERLLALQSQHRRDDARFASDLQLQVAERERGLVGSLIRDSEAAARDAGPTTPAMVRQRVRTDLANAGRLAEAAAYDKATEPPGLTVTNTPYGYKTSVLDQEGNVVREVDNASEHRAATDLIRATRSDAGRAQRPVSQEDLFKLSEQASKQAERLGKSRPHPFPDPLATDKDANRDLAFQRAAEGIYRETLGEALAAGVAVAPDRIDRLVLRVHEQARTGVVAEANDLASKLFDSKGRPNTGADAALAKLGIRASSRDEFVRAYYDANIESAMNDVITAGRQARAGQGSGGQPPASSGTTRRSEGAAQKAAGRAVTDRQREDRGFTPVQTGLIGGAAGDAPSSGPSAAAPSALDDLGTALDAARQERATARAELERFGLRQQKQDPAGFRAAKERVTKADEAARRAQAAYERAATGGRNQVGFSALQRGD